MNTSATRAPYPWEDETTRELVIHPEPAGFDRSADIAVMADAIPGDAHDAMLTFRDPASREKWVRAARHEMSTRVDGLLTIATEQRIDAGTKALPVTLAPEARLVADIVETLEGVKSIAQAGIDVAKGGAEALLAEHGPLRQLGSQSQRYPAGIDQEIKVTRSQRTEATVDADVVVDVVTEHLRAGYVDSADDGIYADGVRDGMNAVLRLLRSQPWSQTAIKALIAEMEATEDQDAQTRAIRLTHALGVITSGNPTIKIERLEK